MSDVEFLLLSGPKITILDLFAFSPVMLFVVLKIYACHMSGQVYLLKLYLQADRGRTGAGVGSISFSNILAAKFMLIGNVNCCREQMEEWRIKHDEKMQLPASLVRSSLA